MPIVVGVDAGGSATEIVAEHDARNVGAFVADPANLRTVGVEQAADIVARGIESLLRGASPDAVVVGAAGAGAPALAHELRIALESRLPAARVAVEDDATVAFRAAVPRGDGAVLIAGTGSIAGAWVRGERFRAGGHGLLLGDEGSAASLGAAGVRALLRSYDGRGAVEPLCAALAETLGVATASGVHDAIYGEAQPARKLASLAPIVLAAAAAGERSATKIVQGAAVDLADMIKTVLRRAGAERDELPLVFAGGLLSHNSLLTYLLEGRVMSDLPNVRICKGGPAPAYGALALAHDLLAR